MQVIGPGAEEKFSKEVERGERPIPLPPGKYRLVVSKSGRKPFDRMVVIESDKRLAIPVRLLPEVEPDPVKPEVASVASNAKPVAADVPSDDIRLLHTLGGHTDVVNDIAFMPDCSQLLSGSEDKTVRLWDTRSGDYVETLIDWPGKVFAVDISPDGKNLVVAGYDEDTWIWDLDTRSRVTKLSCRYSILAARFSPDGQYLGLGAVRRLRLYRAPQWEQGPPIELPAPRSDTDRGGYIAALAFSCDSRRIAYAAFRLFDPEGLPHYACMNLWNINESKSELESRVSGDGICCVALNPDSTLVAFGSRSRVEVWDTSTGKQLVLLEGHGNYVVAVAFSPDGGYLASGDKNGGLRLWRVADWEPVADLSAHTESIRQLRFSPDGRLLASCSEDKTIRIWDVSALTEAVDYDAHREVAEWVLEMEGVVDLRPEGEDSVIVVQPSESLPQEPFTIDQITLTKQTLANGLPGDWPERIADAGRFRQLTLNGLGTTEEDVERLGDLSVKALNLSQAKIGDNGLRLIASNWPRITAMNVSETAITDAALDALPSLPNLGKLDIRETQVSDSGIGSLKKLKKLKWLNITGTQITAAGVAELRAALPYCEIVWDGEPLGEIRLLHTIEGHTDNVSDIAFMPDGSQLISGSEDKTVRLWDTGSGDFIETLINWPERVFAVDVTPDGMQLVVAGSSEPWIWQIDTRIHTATLPNPRTTYAARFSPDGRYLGIGSAGYLQLYRGPQWNLERTIELPPPESNDSRGGSVTGLAFSHDAQRVALRAHGVFVPGKDEKFSRASAQDIDAPEVGWESLQEWDQIGCVAMTSDSTLAAFGFRETIELRDGLSGEHIDVLKGAEWIRDGARVFSR